MDLLCFCSVLCLLCFVRVCLYVLRGHLLGKGWPLGSRLWCLLWVCHFPIGILGQVWYLIVSIPDLCNLTYFIYFAANLTWGEFNNTSALGRSLYWCQALHIMNKVRYQSTSARRALALLNSPLVIAHCLILITEKFSNLFIRQCT